jgi:CheY-like chemotaxis protein
VHSSALAHERLLVANDKPIIAAGLQQVLEDQGATVFPASNVTHALRLLETPGLSAAVIETQLCSEDAEPVCDALSQRQVPFIFCTAWPDRTSSRWSAVPFVSQFTPVPAIIGALKFALSANKQDILSPLGEQSGVDPSLVAISKTILDGEKRIARVTRIIACLKAGGFDTSAAEALLATMTTSLNLMRDQRCLLASEKWRLR